MIMSDDIAREVIRDRTTQTPLRQKPRHPRAARALRGLADRIDRQT
jgi:hypothetical protein